ncbi:MAG: histidine kinase, partial [Acinetobacter sp.]
YDDSIQSLYRALILQKGKMNVAVLRRNVLKSLSTLVFNRPYINGVLVSSGNEKLFEFGEAVSSEDETLYHCAMQAQGRPIWIEARKLRNTVRVNDQYYISMLRAISDLNAYGQYIAVCRISFTESVLSDALRELSAYTDGVTTIYDVRGNVVATTNKELLGQNRAQMQALQLLLQDQRASGYVQTVDGGHGETHLFFRMDDPAWIVVQTVGDAHFQAPFVALIVLMAGSLLFCMIFAIVYSLVIGKTVLRPIKMMHREMDRVRKGDMNISLSYESEDEIGQLDVQLVRMAHELQELIESEYKQQILLKEAELQNLESQINPHFLYNTLDTIHWMAVKNKDTLVSEQIVALSDLFRHVLNKGEEMTTLGEELL